MPAAGVASVTEHTFQAARRDRRGRRMHAPALTARLGKVAAGVRVAPGRATVSDVRLAELEQRRSERADLVAVGRRRSDARVLSRASRRRAGRSRGARLSLPPARPRAPGTPA